MSEFDRARTLSRDDIARRVALDIPRDSYVNLGIGLPTLIADHLPASAGVTMHTENGLLGMGPRASEGEEDWDLINAGKIPVTELPGASYFDHAASFAMMRGGHLDICVMGAFQVSRSGNLANWATLDPEAIPSVGGAMDLAVGARSVFVMMSLFDREGNSKLVDECTYPLTGLGCVRRVYTEHGVFTLDSGAVALVDVFGIAPTALVDRIPFPVRIDIES